jgi:hypothetical protein
LIKRYRLATETTKRRLSKLARTAVTRPIRLSRMSSS